MDSSEVHLMFVVEGKMEFIVNGNLSTFGTYSVGVNDFALTVKPFALI